MRVALVAAILVAGGCRSASSPGVGVNVGDTAPPIAGTSLDGVAVTLAQFRGRPVVVNFWASTCVPCRDEFPLFKAELAKHPDLAIVGVMFKDSPDLARDFYARFGATWPTVQDADGSLAAAYRVVAPPQSYFIDRSGIVRSRQIGQVVEADFERQFAAISQ